MFFDIYLIIGSIIAIPLSRIYWINWRNTPSKSNIILPLKIQNRLVDSFVFLIAYAVIIFLYPIYMIELIVSKKKKESLK